MRKAISLSLLPFLLLALFPPSVQAAGMTCTVSATPSPAAPGDSVKVVGTWSGGSVQPISYTINYGDGNTFSNGNTSLSGSTTKFHTYGSVGTYTVTFNAIDSALNTCAQASTTETIIAFAVLACTSFQFACWAYPLMFWMMYIIIFVMVAGFGGAGSRGTVYLMLVGWTYSSFVMVMMGMLPITFPMLLTVMTAVYVWRFR